MRAHFYVSWSHDDSQTQWNTLRQGLRRFAQPLTDKELSGAVQPPTSSRNPVDKIILAGDHLDDARFKELLRATFEKDRVEEAFKSLSSVKDSRWGVFSHAVGAAVQAQIYADRFWDEEYDRMEL